MYAACLFCHRSFGRNTSVEALPFGSRLAYESAKGRLWIVCSHCGRWNLTPLEERWEAIEECERAFEHASARASTTNIALARCRSGLELIRVGESPRLEFATWRYARSFARRHRRWLIAGASGAVLATGGVVAGVSAGLTVVGALGYTLAVAGRLPMLAWRLPLTRRRENVRHTADVFTLESIRDARLIRAETGWALDIYALHGPERRLTVTGLPAAQILRRGLPVLNGIGSSQKKVSAAVDRVANHNTVDAFVDALISGLPEDTDSPASDAESDWLTGARPGTVGWMPAVDRLALEMMLNDTVERDALAMEFTALLAAWREAEEVAAIADDLLLPAWVGDWLSRHKRIEESSGQAPKKSLSASDQNREKDPTEP